MFLTPMEVDSISADQANIIVRGYKCHRVSYSVYSQAAQQQGAIITKILLLALIEGHEILHKKKEDKR